MKKLMPIFVLLMSLSALAQDYYSEEFQKCYSKEMQKVQDKQMSCAKKKNPSQQQKCYQDAVAMNQKSVSLCEKKAKTAAEKMAQKENAKKEKEKKFEENKASNAKVADESSNVFALEKISSNIKTVKIGKLEWMSENLNIDISGVLKQMGGDAVCYLGKSENCEKYGKLYNYVAAVGVCRGDGWRLPKANDYYDVFASVFDVVDEDSLDMKDLLAVFRDPSFKNGTNQTGLSIVAGGFRAGYDNQGMGDYGIYWTSTEGTGLAKAFAVQKGLRKSNLEDDLTHVFVDMSMTNFFSVRCVRDIAE